MDGCSRHSKIIKYSMGSDTPRLQPHTFSQNHDFHFSMGSGYKNSIHIYIFHYLHCSLANRVKKLNAVYIS